MIARLTDDQRTQALAALPDWTWQRDRDAITRSFRFATFRQAWGFMSQVALAAEQADHHPEWFNVYNRVDVLLTTHDANGLSQRDIDMAKLMDELGSS